MPKEYEDVEATLQHDTTPDTSQKEKWRAIDWIAGNTLVAEALLSTIWAIAWAFGCRFEHQLQVYLALVLIILTGGYLALIFCPIFKKDDDPRWFHARILSSGIVGGSYAFLLPVVMSLPEGNVNSGGAAALRQAILLATGGLIALIALGETRRKNDNDKLKNDQDKEKNDREHLRQVRAGRRERYTKAVEQLGDEKSTVRMGGVYTLVGLVDEWLEEKSLSDDQRFKEGQVIINNLCAYIRSPFTPASRKANLQAEADVRLSIIKEIHDRLQGPDKNIPGAWSDFEYNFSGSTFFYPINLTKSYYKKPVNFDGSTYQELAVFSGSTYEKGVIFSTSDSPSTYQDVAVFSDSTYYGKAVFSDSIYQDLAVFSDSIYQDLAAFSDSTYEKSVIFSTSDSPSTYQDVASFSDSTYQELANFGDSTYEKGVIFSTSDSPSTYQGSTHFGDSTYYGKASFSGSTYQDLASFSDSIYKNKAYFNDSTYLGRAAFSGSTYESEAEFSRSVFYQETYFGEDGDINSFSRFTDCTPQFYNEKSHQNALFGSPNNNFTVENGRGYPIYRSLEGLPLDCKFLTSEQKEYLEGKFQEIEKINNKLLEVKDPKEKAELSKKLQALNEELHKWREEVTTV